MSSETSSIAKKLNLPPEVGELGIFVSNILKRVHLSSKPGKGNRTERFVYSGEPIIVLHVVPAFEKGGYAWAKIASPHGIGWVVHWLLKRQDE